MMMSRLVLKKIFQSVFLVLVAGVATLLRAECLETNNPLGTGCSIAPATLEINLGPVPLDHYLDRNNHLDGSAPGTKIIQPCPETTAVRTCIVDMLVRTSPTPVGYKHQEVTAVRFMFALGGGGSTAFYTYRDGNGNLQGTPEISRKWLNNLELFFQDLARTVGVRKIIPSPALGGYWGAGPPGNGPFSEVRQNVPTCGGSKTLFFTKFAPYGFDPANGYDVDCFFFNSGYNTGAINPIFWGWTPFFNLVDAVLQRAVAAGLTVSEFDIENEVNLTALTIQGRLICDNQPTLINPNVPCTNVLTEVRTRMDKYFGSGAGLRATYSTVVSNPSSCSEGGNSCSTPTPLVADGFDCGSYYGDTAMIMGQSALTAAIGESYIGAPDGWGGRLGCGGTTGSMIKLPIQAMQQPKINDFHYYACIRKPHDSQDPKSHPTRGRCFDPGLDSSYNLPANFASKTSRNFYGIAGDQSHYGVVGFITQHGLTGNSVVIGETNWVLNPSSDACWRDLGYDQTMAYSNVNGFSGFSDGMGNTTSYLQQAVVAGTVNSVVLRVWENLGNACLVMPNTINPPFNP